MPLFDFQCEKCEATKVDVWLRPSEDTVENHPVCECGEKMTKEVSRVSAKFIGRGFYCNEYHAPTRGY